MVNSCNHPFRSHNCGELRIEQTGNKVRLSGWIHRKRDHGNLLFIDLRDHYGITQLVIENNGKIFEALEKVRPESVITASGSLEKRSLETVNKDIPTGEVELRIEDLNIESPSQELPLQVFGDGEFPEDIRLKYRFIDLRREEVHKNIILRSKVITSIRQRMIDQGFLEIQTPILTATSPEGARDYLVPSRVHPGKFYALPQAPQIFKQMLMVSGFDKYFQIAPCFRDEDARADRSPGEFYQLDIEMSFVTQEDVFNAVEPVLQGVFEEFSGSRVVSESQFPRIPYKDSIKFYGSDKPDLRNPIKMSSATHVFAGSGFKVFAGMIERDPKVEVWAIPAPGGGSRAFCDRMNSWAQEQGQPGLGYIFFRDGEGAGPLAKNIGIERTDLIRNELSLGDGDAIFFVAGLPKTFTSFAAQARMKIGEDLDLVSKNQFKFCWIVDYPMYEFDADLKKVIFSHNPFSMPQGKIEELNFDKPLEIKAYQYDIVCNGIELSSGAIRNHLPELMYKLFSVAGYSKDQVNEKFSGIINAFSYGAPPHGGIAPGIDRIVMLLAGKENIREVTLFPMNQNAQDLMMKAPSEVDEIQLKELSIKKDIKKN